MPFKKTDSDDYQSLTSPARGGDTGMRDPGALKPLTRSQTQTTISNEPAFASAARANGEEIPSQSFPPKRETARNDSFASGAEDENLNDNAANSSEPSRADWQKPKKSEKKGQKDRKLLGGERWLAKNGHTLTYVGLYLFSILVLFRPYELIPSLSFLSATAFYFAAATLLIFIPTQLVTEGNLTAFPTEVKAVLAMTLLALITIPIAKSPPLAWEQFNDTFTKAVLMFVIMVNVIRTRRRLMGMIWLSLAIGVVLSYMALGMYMRGEMKVEGYRVGGVIRGMFENPNEMSMHLIMMIPLAITLALASKNKIIKSFYLIVAVFLLSANMITFSRGGFLGLLASSAVLVWKLGRKNRVGVTISSLVVGGLVILLAPGNYGLRVLSIFIPGLDPVGSSDQRRELLERSILVTLRNPWGIGIGNFPIVGVRNLVSHNAYTQVSSELGLLGLAAYLIFIISPFRKLGAIERTLFDRDERDWFYYLAIGLQASIVAYLVSSFFASVAYNWFIYYLIAYAVAFRRIYQIEKGLTEDVRPKPLWQWQTA